MELLYEIIFLLTPDHRNGRVFGYTVLAVACVANQHLGAEFCLRTRSWDGVSGICRRGQRAQNAQNAQNGHKISAAKFRLEYSSQGRGYSKHPKPMAPFWNNMTAEYENFDMSRLNLEDIRQLREIAAEVGLAGIGLGQIGRAHV